MLQNTMLPMSLNLIGTSTSYPQSVNFFDQSYSKLNFPIGYHTLSQSRDYYQIPRSEYYIVLGYYSTHANGKLGKLSGGTHTVTNGVNYTLSTELYTSVNVSNNYRYACFGSDSALSVIDMHTNTIVFGKSGLADAPWGGYVVTCNADCTRVWCGGQVDSAKYYCFDVATGNTIYEVSGNISGSLFYKDDTDELWYYTNTGGKTSFVRADPNTGNILETFASPTQGVTYDVKVVSFSPDGRFLSFKSYWNGPERVFDTVNKVFRTFGVTTYGNPFIWLNDHTFFFHSTSPNKNSLYYIPDLELDKSIEFANPMAGGYTWSYQQVLAVGEFGSFQVTLDITNTTQETSFYIECKCMGRTVHIVTATDVTTGITIRLPIDDPVDIIVSGIKRDLRESSTAYAVGDEIQVLDTNYIYECTTGGTTGSIPPPYPTTGSVTDGTAVFLTKHKIAETTTYTHIVPEPI